MKKTFLLLLLVAPLLEGCVVHGFAEPKVEVRQPLPVELSYRQAKGGLVILTGRVNDRADVAFILDTGAPVSVLFDGSRTAALGLDTRAARPLGDPADPATPFGTVQGGFRWDFGPVSLTDLTAVIVPQSSLPCRERFEEVDFAGVIGADLFRRFVVEIDPANHRVRLHDPLVWQAPRGAASVPITFRSSHPYVPTRLMLAGGEEIEHELNLDLGMSRALSLVAGSPPSIVMPVDGKKQTSCLVSGTLEERLGPAVSVSIGGGRLDAESPTYSNNPRVKVQRNGAIGMALFAGRRLAVDYPGRRLLILE